MIVNTNPQPIVYSPMDTHIFNQNLSVLATSAYILIAAVQSDGLKPDLETIRARWNVREDELEMALAELRALNIIERHPGPVYIVNPASLWKTRRKD
ncbi:MAG: hypothetical protein AMR96_05205 [Candidatus Adiutrix intracellularis]|nr:MAG: hypothetical protein AMR96_05205 [Candidatus Adiutrix intracellularis]